LKASKSPFHGFVDTFAEMGRMREHVLHGPEERTQATAWVPTIDILVHDDDIIIRCELAGVDNEDIEVSLSNNTLWIWGERNHPPDEEGQVSFYVRERSMGPFRRSINLPSHIDASNLRASFEDGLLEIVIVDAISASEVERIAIQRRSTDTTVRVSKD
jgi:HSP20 family protein